jgi:hypothetical protein
MWRSLIEGIGYAPANSDSPAKKIEISFWNPWAHQGVMSYCGAEFKGTADFLKNSSQLEM